MLKTMFVTVMAAASLAACSTFDSQQRSTNQLIRTLDVAGCQILELEKSEQKVYVRCREGGYRRGHERENSENQDEMVAGPTRAR